MPGWVSLETVPAECVTEATPSEGSASPAAVAVLCASYISWRARRPWVPPVTSPLFSILASPGERA